MDSEDALRKILGEVVEAAVGEVMEAKLEPLNKQLTARGKQLTALGTQLTALGTQLTARGKQVTAGGTQLTARGKQVTALGTQLTARGKQLTAVERATAAAAESSARTATALRKLDGYWPRLTMFDGERRAGASPQNAGSQWLPCHAPSCTWLRTMHAGCTCQRVSVLSRHVGWLRAPCFGPCPEWISWCCCRLCCAAHAAPLLLPVQRATWWNGWPLKATPLIWTRCWTRWLRGIAATSSCSNCCCTDWR